MLRSGDIITRTDDVPGVYIRSDEASVRIILTVITYRLVLLTVGDRLALLGAITMSASRHTRRELE